MVHLCCLDLSLIPKTYIAVEHAHTTCEPTHIAALSFVSILQLRLFRVSLHPKKLLISPSITESGYLELDTRLNSKSSVRVPGIADQSA